MPNSADVLQWSTLTPAVNEMKSPNSFIKDVFFGREQAVETRNIELSFMDRGRQIAPFILRDGEAIMTAGRTESFRVIQPPHIRIKRPMTASDLMNKRRPGSVVFPGRSGIRSAIREYMANELSMLNDDVSNSEELLAAQALTGVISYSAPDESVFTITFPRSGDHNYALASADRWTASTASPRKDFLDAAELISDAVSLTATDVILGTEAADAFLADAHGELGTLLEYRRLDTGMIDLTQQFAQSGALFLGTFVHGIRVWRYGRKVDVNGVSTDLIRPKYAEFVARTPAAEMLTYYGAIEDMKAIGAGNVLASKRFSKSWEVEDPSARMLLLESNPMPVMRRPNATVSIQVVA
jgi:hypothetical protein